MASQPHDLRQVRLALVGAAEISVSIQTADGKMDTFTVRPENLNRVFRDKEVLNKMINSAWRMR